MEVVARDESPLFRLLAVTDDGPLYPWFAHFKDTKFTA